MGSMDEGEHELSVTRRTPREQQVLNRMREGLSNRRVGRSLGISERTVKVHVRSIFLKLGAASRTEAVVQGIRRGCISI